MEAIIAGKGFWDNPEATKPILKERTMLSDLIESFDNIYKEFEESEILLDLAVEESDPETLEEVTRQVQVIDEKIKKLSLDIMLNGPDDPNNAIFSLSAGGLERKDSPEYQLGP